MTRVPAVKASLKRAHSPWWQTRNRVIYTRPGCSAGNAGWRPEPISVEKLLDEPRVGVKGQSNSEIARTPRKAFRCRVRCSAREVERPIGCEGFTACQVLTNSECSRYVAAQ